MGFMYQKIVWYTTRTTADLYFNDDAFFSTSLSAILPSLQASSIFPVLANISPLVDDEREVIVTYMSTCGSKFAETH